MGPVDAGDLEADEHGRALLVAMPARHLEAARASAPRRASATLPAGGPGDLDVTPTGTLVLVIETEDEEAAPAATWRAVFEGRVPHVPGEPWPAGLPRRGPRNGWSPTTRAIGRRRPRTPRRSDPT